MDTPDLYYGNQREALITTYAQCDSLIHRDPMTGEYQPLLATAWKWTDPKTLDITLREGVRFHDGSSFGAEDVAYTRSEEHTSELQSLMRISYAVFCLKKKKQHANNQTDTNTTQSTPHLK